MSDIPENVTSDSCLGDDIHELLQGARYLRQRALRISAELAEQGKQNDSDAVLGMRDLFEGVADIIEDVFWRGAKFHPESFPRIYLYNSLLIRRLAKEKGVEFYGPDDYAAEMEELEDNWGPLQDGHTLPSPITH